MKKRVVVCLAAGSLLTVVGCGTKAGASTDGSNQVDTDITMNPPPMPPPLPRWDEVVSGHPEGATNPPHPVLYVNPTTNVCFKKWMGARQPVGDAIRTDCPSADDSCGIEVLCPEDGRAEALIAEWKKPKPPEPIPTSNPPPPAVGPPPKPSKVP